MQNQPHFLLGRINKATPIKIHRQILILTVDLLLLEEKFRFPIQHIGIHRPEDTIVGKFCHSVVFRGWCSEG